MEHSPKKENYKDEIEKMWEQHTKSRKGLNARCDYCYYPYSMSFCHCMKAQFIHNLTIEQILKFGSTL